jgi:hypothetical protein
MEAAINKFSNPNAISLIKWVFLKRDDLKIINLFFLSRRYFSNARHFAILEQSTNIRIVVIRFLNIPFLDRFILKLYPMLFRLLSNKISEYEFYFGNNFKVTKKLDMNVTIDLDDIEYTIEEIQQIYQWESYRRQYSKCNKIIVTCDYAKKYLIDKEIKSEVQVASQCYSGNPSDFYPTKKEQKIKFCYISPIIVSSGDRLQGHKNWDITNFFEEILPIFKPISNLELHLIGVVGKVTQQKIKAFSVVIHGPKDIVDSRAIMSSCHFGIYPRVNDNFRQAHKIVEYVGAGIPIISYRLIDTNLVELFNLGWLADSSNEFISLLSNIDVNSNQYLDKRKNVFDCQSLFSAIYVASLIEDIITK